MKLSRTERDVLRFFERNRGKYLTRTDIVAAVWEEKYLGLTNIVDVNVFYGVVNIRSWEQMKVS